MESERTHDRQMTLDVGAAGFGPDPIVLGTFKVTGTLAADRQIDSIGEAVVVTITDADGQVVASAEGHISAIPLIEHESKDAPPWIERQHKAKIDK